MTEMAGEHKMHTLLLAVVQPYVLRQGEWGQCVCVWVCEGGDALSSPSICSLEYRILALRGLLTRTVCAALWLTGGLGAADRRGYNRKHFKSSDRLQDKIHPDNFLTSLLASFLLALSSVFADFSSETFLHDLILFPTSSLSSETKTFLFFSTESFFSVTHR